MRAGLNELTALDDERASRATVPLRLDRDAGTAARHDCLVRRHWDSRRRGRGQPTLTSASSWTRAPRSAPITWLVGTRTERVDLVGGLAV